MKTTKKLTVLSTALLFASSTVFAQQFVYPAKGQSPQQQQKDEGECHVWATQQSGYDPSRPPPAQASQAPATTATGTTPGAGLRGAARGAVVAGVADGDSGKGAAAGAVMGRAQSRRHNAAASQQQQQQASQQQQAGQQAYQKARGACLEGRGYSVK